MPLLFGLADSVAERRQRDLYEQAVAAALAHHDPQNVSALIGKQEEPDSQESEFVTPAWKENPDG